MHCWSLEVCRDFVPFVPREASSTQPTASPALSPVPRGLSADQVVNNAVSGVPDLVPENNVSCYKVPLDSVQQELLSRKTFSENTNAKINWAVNLYRDWYFQRCKSAQCASNGQIWKVVRSQSQTWLIP